MGYWGCGFRSYSASCRFRWLGCTPQALHAGDLQREHDLFVFLALHRSSLSPSSVSAVRPRQTSGANS